MAKKIVSVFIIGKDTWKVQLEVRTKRAVEVEEYHVIKNGQPWENGNGSWFESETEAALNILNEYFKDVKDED